MRGPAWARESVLCWAARHAGTTGTVHVICEDDAYRRMVGASVTIGLLAGVASPEFIESAESADFAAAAAVLAPFGTRWTWRYLPWGARAAAERQARKLGAVMVLPRRRRSAPVRVIELES